MNMQVQKVISTPNKYYQKRTPHLTLYQNAQTSQQRKDIESCKRATPTYLKIQNYQNYFRPFRRNLKCQESIE
jgi:hypothetical protein